MNKYNLVPGNKYRVTEVAYGQALITNQVVIFIGYDKDSDLVFQSDITSKVFVVSKDTDFVVEKVDPENDKIVTKEGNTMAEIMSIFQGNKLVRYLGQGWNGGTGIRALGYPDFPIPDSVEKILVMLPDSPQTFTLERDKFEGTDYDHGHEYSWTKLDFTCEYIDPVIGRPRKFSLFEYLGGDYDCEDHETSRTSNYVTVVRVIVKE